MVVTYALEDAEKGLTQALKNAGPDQYVFEESDLELRSKIGMGHWGEVYLARSTRLGFDCVVKRLHADHVATIDAVRLKKDLSTLASLSNPFIVGTILI